MNKKFFIPAIIVVILVVAGGFLAARNSAKQESENASKTEREVTLNEQLAGQNATSGTATPSATPVASPTPTPTPPPDSHFSGPGDSGEGVDTQVFEVDYNGTNFSPASLSVRVGDVVIFKNSSSSAFWPASNPHPQHTDYPEFDAKKPIAAGQSFQFKFTKAGTWGFHNHLNAGAKGTIIVK